MGTPDPNPGFGKSTRFQKLYAAGVMLYLLPKTLLSVLVAQLFKRHKVPFRAHFKRSIVRGSLSSLPRKVLRASGDAQIEKVLSSPRFSAVRDNLFIPIKTSTFSAYWICQGSVSAKKDPRDTDITLLFAHGGGYVIGDVSQTLAFLLRIAEVIESQGLSVSILTLEYSLAPEAPFPTQLQQANAAYSYLLNAVGIPADKIALMGDSAGGNLVMSLLTSLTIPLAPSTTKLPKPLAIYLLSAWLTFNHTSPTFTSNADIDFLNKPMADRWASYLRGKTPQSQSTIDTYTEFVYPVPGRIPLSEILPRAVLVSAGAEEVFSADNQAFAKLATEAGADVTLTVTEGQAHDWEFAQLVANEAEYLNTTGDLGEDFSPGAVALASAMVETVRKNRAPSPRL